MVDNRIVCGVGVLGVGFFCVFVLGSFGVVLGVFRMDICVLELVLVLGPCLIGIGVVLH